MILSDEQIFKILQKASLEAGKIQLESYNKKHSISQKEIPADLVTEVDIKSQDAIIKYIKDSLISFGIDENEIGFIGEEGVEQIAKHQFIIDPLDGTNNYIERNGNFCISIAYLIDGILTAAIVLRPTEETFFYAKKEGGSFRIINGEREVLNVKNVPLSNAMVSFNSSPWPEVSEKIFKAALSLVYKVKRIRETRSGVLTALSVLDKSNISINGKTKIWDIAAAKLIIEEAGGVMTDWAGNEIELDINDIKKSYAIVTTHKELLGEVIKIIHE